MSMKLVYIFKNIYLINNKNIFFYTNFLTVIHVGLGNKMARDFLASWIFIMKE